MARLRAKFDGKVLVPSGPVDFLPGQEVELEVIPPVEPRRGSPAAVLAAMRGAPHLSAEDMEEFRRALAEGKSQPNLAGVFDEPTE
jgi:hypothetical protein